MCCALSDGSPRISGRDGVESRWSPDGGKNLDQRFEVQKRRWVGVGVGVGEVAKTSRLREERRESDQVVDLIFELKIIHERK
jgi:hypothetical protein